MAGMAGPAPPLVKPLDPEAVLCSLQAGLLARPRGRLRARCLGRARAGARSSSARARGGWRLGQARPLHGRPLQEPGAQRPRARPRGARPRAGRAGARARARAHRARRVARAAAARGAAAARDAAARARHQPGGVHGGRPGRGRRALRAVPG